MSDTPGRMTTTRLRSDIAAVVHAAAVEGRRTVIVDRLGNALAVVVPLRVAGRHAGPSVDMPITEVRAVIASVVGAASRGRVTYVVNRGRRMAAIVPAD